MRREIKAELRAIKMIGYGVTGIGTATLSGEGKFRGTLVDNGVGDYTITFTEAFGRAPIAVATALTADIVCRIKAISLTSVTIECKSNAGVPAATDADFNLMVYGSEVADQQ